MSRDDGSGGTRAVARMFAANMAFTAVAFTAVALTTVALGAAACASSPAPRLGGLPKDAPPNPNAGAGPVPDSARDDLAAWLAREAVLIGDEVEIDCTRKPFLAELAVPAAGSPGVRTTQSTDPATGASVIVMEATAGVIDDLDSAPSVRFSAGFAAYARKKLTLRIHPSAARTRPAFLDGTASGRATYFCTRPAKRFQGSRVGVSAEISDDGTGFAFHDRERASP